MENFDSTDKVRSDLAELRRLMSGLPTALPGSAHRELTIQLIRQLLARVDRNIKSNGVYSGADLERRMIQDWFDDTLGENGFARMNVDHRWLADGIP